MNMRLISPPPWALLVRCGGSPVATAVQTSSLLMNIAQPYIESLLRGSNVKKDTMGSSIPEFSFAFSENSGILSPIIYSD
jgi:hypothetical protein